MLRLLRTEKATAVFFGDIWCLIGVVVQFSPLKTHCSLIHFFCSCEDDGASGFVDRNKGSGAGYRSR